MGTPNLTAVFHKGAYRIAQYGQWDGYPEGQGAKVLEFCHTLRNPGALDEFKSKLEQCRFVPDAEITEVTNSMGIGEWMNSEKQQKFARRFPLFSRDHGAEILSLVSQCDDPELQDRITFAKYSLFCEWAYVIDLDAGTLEVFKGFNHDPLESTERFYGPADERGYYPVRISKTYQLSTLPDLKTFVSELNPKEEE